MWKRLKKSFSHVGPLLMLLLVLSAPAYAVDGVVEINQAKAEAGGVTASDTAGFPVTIDSAGSYRLTGNLTVPDENTTAIAILADNVTVDLNGFAIIGPGTAGSGIGIQATILPSPLARGTNGLTVVNGIVRGMGSIGVFLIQESRVERVHAMNNGLVGIACQFNCILERNIASNNASVGLFFDTGGGYANNVLAENNGGNANPQVSGGIQMGTNVCGTTICP